MFLFKKILFRAFTLDGEKNGRHSRRERKRERERKKVLLVNLIFREICDIIKCTPQGGGKLEIRGNKERGV